MVHKQEVLCNSGGNDYSVNYTFQPGVDTVVELYADIYTQCISRSTAGNYIKGKLFKELQIYYKFLGTTNVPGSTKQVA